MPIAGLILKRVYSDEQLYNTPSLYRYSNGIDKDHKTTAYSTTAFTRYLIIAVVQGLLMEWLFINAVGSTDRDFTSHAVFYCIYGLQDWVQIWLTPNITWLFVGLIVGLHGILFILAWLLSSSSIQGGMVPYMSLQ